MRLVTGSPTSTPAASTIMDVTGVHSKETFDSDMENAAKRAAMDHDGHLAHPSLERQSKGELKKNSSLWSNDRLPYAVPGALLAAATLTAILAYVIIKKRRKAASSSEAPREQTVLKDCHKFTVHVTHNQQPPAMVATTDTVALETFDQSTSPPTTNHKRCPNQKLDLAPAVPPHVRVKNMGLLERRGSNASLTIDVNPITIETFHLPSPPKECCAIELLASASNRLNRRQLRQYLTDTKTLHQEFLDIPLNHPKKLDLPGCSIKNRYKSIWPNECTRVLLPVQPSPSSIPAAMLNEKSCDQNGTVVQNRSSNSPHQSPNVDDDDTTTYINANYITGYDNNPKAYIATQGPLTNTIDDFWSMVWQERCPCIVMMTRLNENEKVKCEQYLPAQQAKYGDIRVTVTGNTEKKGYRLTDVTMQKGDETRQISHFWFTNWPDHKAPSCTAKQLIELVQDVESGSQRYQVLNGPIVVHCSAGLGRTGCFIATAIGMQQLREENTVDILAIVCQMRIDRGGMIQTVEQYEFLHHVLALYERQLPVDHSSDASSLLSPSQHRVPREQNKGSFWS